MDLNLTKCIRCFNFQMDNNQIKFPFRPTIFSGSTRLEVKSQKGSRNHFREDGMLTFVTHANY